MANYFAWVCFLLVAFNAVSSDTEYQNSVLQPQEGLDPVQQVQLSSEDAEGGDREKRLGLIKKIGLKAGLLDFVFGKIDSVIDAKTRFVNELDKQNIYKNEKYFGISYPPRAPPNNLVNNLFAIKKNLVGTAVSSIIQAKLGSLSGGGGQSDGGNLISGILGASSSGGSGGLFGGGDVSSGSSSGSLGGSLGGGLGGSLGGNLGGGLSGSIGGGGLSGSIGGLGGSIGGGGLSGSIGNGGLSGSIGGALGSTGY